MSNKKKQSTGTQQESTKERIRHEAMKEFAAEGFAGARVDRISKAAGVNIRMIYYFFGSKEALLKDVVSEIFRQRRSALPTTHESPAELLIAYLDGFSFDPDTVRLLVWEALQTPAGSANLLTNFEERRDVIKQRVDGIRALQKKGLIPANIDPKLFYLLCVALTIYPWTFPHTIYTVTGRYPSNKTFQKQYKEFMKQIADLIMNAAKNTPSGK